MSNEWLQKLEIKNFFSANSIRTRNDRKKWGLKATIQDLVNHYFILFMQTDGLFAEKWILKGGACLSICYYEDKDGFRFSNDLDFETSDPTLKMKTIREKLQGICNLMEGLSEQQIKFGHIKCKQEGGYIKTSIPYTLAGFPSEKCALKISVSNYEKIVDLLPEGPYELEMTLPFLHYQPRIKAYSREEICAEMLRAFVERLKEHREKQEPYLLKKIIKSIYDLDHLLRGFLGYLCYEEAQQIIREKFAHKNLSFPDDLKNLEIPEIPLELWERFFDQDTYTVPRIEEFKAWGEDRKDDLILHLANHHTEEVKKLINKLLDAPVRPGTHPCRMWKSTLKDT